MTRYSHPLVGGAALIAALAGSASAGSAAAHSSVSAAKRPGTLSDPTVRTVDDLSQALTESSRLLRANKIVEADGWLLGAIAAWKTSPSSLNVHLLDRQIFQVASAYARTVSLDGGQRAVSRCMTMFSLYADSDPVDDAESDCVELMKEIFLGDTTQLEILRETIDLLLTRPTTTEQNAHLRSDRADIASLLDNLDEAMVGWKGVDKILGGKDTVPRLHGLALLRLGHAQMSALSTLDTGYQTLLRAREVVLSDSHPDLISLRAGVLFELAEASMMFQGTKTFDFIREALEAIRAAESAKRLPPEMKDARVVLEAGRAFVEFSEFGSFDSAMATCRRLLTHYRLITVSPESAARCHVVLATSLRSRHLDRQSIGEWRLAKAASDKLVGLDGIKERISVACRLAGALVDLKRSREALRILRELGANLQVTLLTPLGQADRFSRNGAMNVMGDWMNQSFATIFGPENVTLRDAKSLGLEVLLTTTSLQPEATAFRTIWLDVQDAMTAVVRARGVLAGLIRRGASAVDMDDASEHLRVAEDGLDQLRAKNQAPVGFGTSAGLRGHLRPGEVLTNYVMFRSGDSEHGEIHYGLVALGADKEDVLLKDLGPATSLDRMISEYQDELRRQRLSGWDAGKMAAIALSIRRRVIDPVLQKWPNASRLFVVPTGQLAAWPFECAPDSSKSSGGFLVESRGVVYLRSPRQLLTRNTVPVAIKNDTAVVVGDPDFQGETPIRGRSMISRWPRLAETAGLVDSVSSVFRDAHFKVTPLRGSDATKDSIVGLEVAPRVLLIASHGYNEPIAGEEAIVKDVIVQPGNAFINASSAVAVWDRMNPLVYTGIVLAAARHGSAIASDGAVEPSFLSAYELAAMNLWTTEVVILAACQSGLGYVNGFGVKNGMGYSPIGEAVMGLRQAVFAAGARSLVATLWDVPSKETTGEVNDFVKGWLGGGSRYQAFRSAQLAAIERARTNRGGDHPINWAGLVYFGDPGD